jgi:hypothetical protein
VRTHSVFTVTVQPVWKELFDIVGEIVLWFVWDLPSKQSIVQWLNKGLKGKEVLELSDMKNSSNGLPAGPFPTELAALRFLQWYRRNQSLRYRASATSKPWKNIYKRIQAMQMRSLLRAKKPTTSLIKKMDDIDARIEKATRELDQEKEFSSV